MAVDTQAAIHQGLHPCARAGGEASVPALAEDEAVQATFRGVRLVLGGSGGGGDGGAAADAAGDLVVTTRCDEEGDTGWKGCCVRMCVCAGAMLRASSERKRRARQQGGGGRPKN